MSDFDCLAAEVQRLVALCLHDRDAFALGSCNRSIRAAVRPVIQARLAIIRARRRWRLLRDIVRLCRRVSLAANLVYCPLTTLLEQPRPYETAAALLPAFRWDVDFAALSTCTVRAFGGPEMTVGAERLEEWLRTQDADSLKRVPRWLLSAGIGLAIFWTLSLS